VISLLKVQEGETVCAFYANNIKETALCPTLQPPMTSNSMVEGFFRLGKSWVPVVPLARLLGFEPREIDLFDTLLITGDSNQWAVRVGRIAGMVRCEWSEMIPLTSKSEATPGLAAHLHSEGSLVPVMVLPQLLLEYEKQEMQRQRSVLEARELRARESLESAAEESEDS
jgi:chemotaxis signal transduction protein